MGLSESFDSFWKMLQRRRHQYSAVPSLESQHPQQPQNRNDEGNKYDTSRRFIKISMGVMLLVLILFIATSYG